MALYLNGNPIAAHQYPNHETFIKGEDLGEAAATTHLPGGYNEVQMRYQSDRDLIHLLFVSDWLDTNQQSIPKRLTIPYMPYSRMDRAPDANSVFTLRSVCRFVNSMRFERVMLWEPHSDVCLALLDNVRPVAHTLAMVSTVTEAIGFDPERDYLFFPDAGAQKRYVGLTGYKTAVGFKHRDFATGQLTGDMDVVGPSDLAELAATGRSAKVLILDDLCSRGGTFVMAATKLRELGFREVHLLVTHCEETVYDGDLFGAVDSVFCTDSIVQGPSRSSKLHIYSGGTGT